MWVHLVDGTYELFRAWFGAPGAVSPSGMEVGATRGFLRSMVSLLREPEVTHIACAFDHTIESFRNALFDGYKAGEGIERALLAQFPLVERASRALGMVTWPMVEFEADDALATAAARFSASAEVTRVVLCSPDKDLCQCVTRDRIVTLDRRRNIVLDEQGVREKFGVLPTSIPDYLALVGDSADGIPGVPRWGAKSTATVLAKYNHLEHIPDEAAEWGLRVRGAASLAASLRAHRAEAFLFRELATLRRDVPLEESIDDLRWSGLERGALEALCEEIGETRLLEQVERGIRKRDDR